MLVCILIKMKASNLQPETLIKKQTPSQMFFCEFCKKFKNTFFKEQLDNGKVQLSIYLSLLLFLYFHLTIYKVLIYTVKIAYYRLIYVNYPNNKIKQRLLCTFPQLSLPFKEFIKLNKFGIVRKWLLRGASICTFSPKRKKEIWKKWQLIFSTFYLKDSQSGFLATKSFNFFWLRIYIFCFETEKSFQCKTGCNWDFLHVCKSNTVLVKSDRL